MARRGYTDWFLFAIAAGLAIFGAIMVYSASAMISLKETQEQSQFTYFYKQFAFTVAGLAVMYVTSRIDYHRSQNKYFVFGALAVSTILLLAVFAFPPINGARRWIRFSGFSFQPSEIIKVVLPIFLAWFLTRNEKTVGELRSTVLPCILVLMLLAGLVFAGPDLGTTIVLCAIFSAVYFAAGARIVHIAVVGASMVVLGLAALIVAPWRVQRIMAFLNPYKYSDDSGYQVVQSLYAIGSGGVFGEGFAKGQQKLFYLPYPYSDFIFSVVGEELGLVGTLAVVLAFGLLLWRGARAALLAPDRFGMLLGIGITTGIIVQALFNISVVISILPAKGIPLPFISYGGSSVLVTLFAVGILLNISQQGGRGTSGVIDEEGQALKRKDKAGLREVPMKVMIAAGGTGGHIYPGIAVAKEILRRDPLSEVLFVGTSRGLETKIVPENGFQLSLINSAGLKSVGFAGKIKGLAILPKSFLEARQLLREFRPDVVVGAGGYVSGPVLLIASFMRIPTLVMDSNALPGFTNRRLAMFVKKAALTFEEARPFFGKKGVVTGNPVRKEFFDVPPVEPAGKMELLVFGGSQGARAINNAMVDGLKSLEGMRDRLEITHQTGESDFEKVKHAYRDSGWESADVRPFISDMVNFFAKTDLIICRAGATTCAELAAAGRPAIMIPLPTAADDHQRKNAEALASAGAARMILQSDLTGEKLAGEITELTASPQKIVEMGAAAKKLARADAAEATVDLIEELSIDRR